MKNGVIVIMSLEALKGNTSSVVFFFLHNYINYINTTITSW